MKKLIAISLMLFSSFAFAENSSQGIIYSITDSVVQKNQPDTNQYIGAAGGGIIGYGLGRLVSNNLAIGTGILGVLIGGDKFSKESAYTIVVSGQHGFHTVTQLKSKFPNVVYEVGDKVTLVYMNGEYFVVK